MNNREITEAIKALAYTLNIISLSSKTEEAIELKINELLDLIN